MQRLVPAAGDDDKMKKDLQLTSSKKKIIISMCEKVGGQTLATP
jgi:hypothetical protein